MNVKFRIISKDENNHSIVVRYFTDILTEEILANSFDAAGNVIYDARGYPKNTRADYNYNLYGYDNPTENQIIDFVKDKTPWQWLQTQENIINPNVTTSLSGVNNILYTEQNYTFNPPSSNNILRPIL